MNNEETRILTPDTNSQQSSASENSQSNASSAPETKKSDMAKNAAFAAGGFVAGVAATATVNAMGAEHPAEHPEVKPEAETPVVSEEPHKTEDVQQPEEPKDEDYKPAAPAKVSETVTTIDEGEVPDEHEAILTTDEGVRVAQVSDDMSFSQAFADARAQVGAGGVFEWHGKVYGTYYKDEWDQMSRSERAEFQSKVDYQDVMDAEANAHDVASHVQSSGHHSHHESAVHHTSYDTVDHEYSDSNAHPASEELVAPTTDEGIEVVGAGPMEMPNGEVHNVAVLAQGDDQALIVDVDDDGDFDVLIHDDNGDGQITYNEYHDISAGNITYDDINAQISAQEDPNGMVAYNDDMPDYMNDADAGVYDA